MLGTIYALLCSGDPLLIATGVVIVAMLALALATVAILIVTYPARGTDRVLADIEDGLVSVRTTGRWAAPVALAPSPLATVRARMVRS